MPKEKAILVSTTDSLSGLEIKKYLKPVSTHVVAGTDIFVDFAASFTDIFGGRSKGYQNQLTAIYNQAIEQLKASAVMLGANGIIGLRVDLDEISGRGKAMFMVTAVGTAVIIEYKKDQGPVMTINTQVDPETVENLRKKKEIIQSIRDNQVKLDDGNWEFIKSNQITEAFEYLVDRYKREYEKGGVSEKTILLNKMINSYLEVFDDENKIKLVYERLLRDKGKIVQKKLCELIETFNLVDFSYVNRIMDSGDLELKRLSTTIMTYDKILYDRNDITEIEKVVQRVKEIFPQTGTYATKKGFLSSKEKDVWTCVCGRSNNEIDQVCNSCHKDIYGFTKDESSPPNTIDILEERKELLSELFA